MDNILPAEFLGNSVSIIDRDGQKWMTAEQIGGCLGYDSANARKGVMKLYERHGDEFAPGETCVVKLTTQGQSRATRIFSSTGCVKLGFFSNTSRAKEFRNWASNVLAGGSQPVPAASPAINDKAVALAHELAHQIGQMRQTLELQTGAILELHGKLERSQRSHIRALSEIARVQKRQAVADGIETVIRMEAEGYPRDAIVRATGKSKNYIRQIVFRAREDGRLPPLSEDDAQGRLPLGAGHGGVQ